MSALPVARILGFEIRVHVSWAIILAVIAVTVATQVQVLAPTSTPAERWLLGGIVAAAFLASALAHELGHALAARRAGAPGKTVIVYFFGGAASPNLETRSPRDEIIAAIAGPVVSILIGIVLLAVAGVVVLLGTDALQVVAEVALVVGVLNLALGLINLLPAYPLDGGRVARAVGWLRTGDPGRGLRIAATSGRYVGILLAALGVMLILATDTIDALMLALCGWFLISTGKAVERTASVDDLLRGLHVRDVMDREVTGVPAGLTLDTFADQVLDMPGGSVPVVQGQELVGMLGERQVRGVRRNRWTELRAADVMTARDGLPDVDPETSLRTVLDQLHHSGVDGLPVFEAGRLAGVVTRRAVAQAIHERVPLRGSPTNAS